MRRKGGREMRRRERRGNRSRESAGICEGDEKRKKMRRGKMVGTES